MRALAALTWLSLKLNFRNRTALIYGYLFPLIFLVAFWAIYRNDPVPLVLHVGQFLTITVLGGACFGLPTTIVGERERGVWRRYILAPVPRGVFVISILSARYVLLLTAALLQLILALLLGMPLPVHPFYLWLSFSLVAFCFMAMGMVIAMLVDNVPAVQALGQCIFLPMLMIGGVAINLESLPLWAQHMASFLPGRYAVEIEQGAATSLAWSHISLDALALLLIGLAGSIAAAGMFRWDKSFVPNKSWLGVAIGMWLIVGALAEWQGLVHPARVQDTKDVGTSARYLAASSHTSAAKPQSWHDVSDADYDKIAFDRLPSDAGIVAPVSRADEVPDPAIVPALNQIRAALSDWGPGNVSDPVQRARNLLLVAAVPDILEMEQVERFVPRLVFARLQAVIRPEDLPKILYWIAMHPNDGDDSARHQLKPFGLPDITGPSAPIRGRVMIYAFKLLGRLSGHIPPV